MGIRWPAGKRRTERKGPDGEVAARRRRWRGILWRGCAVARAASVGEAVYGGADEPDYGGGDPRRRRGERGASGGGDEGAGACGARPRSATGRAGVTSLVLA